jgi:hypothetical protein
MSLASLRIVALLSFACSACGPSYLPDGVTHAPEAAAVTTGVAAILYVTAGGCKISGCPTNTVCNPTTERCDDVECTPRSCGPDATCNTTIGRCVSIASGPRAGGAASTFVPSTPALPTPIAGPNANVQN